jgi:predicted short-subunit dehydrogenase-like oxidoreductase (DUF2520 family)
MTRAAPVFVLGGGRVGSLLALGLREAGLLAGQWTRSAGTAARAAALAGSGCAHGPLPGALASAGTLVLAVGDEAVPHLAGALLDAGLLRARPALLHCGGARPAREALAPAAGHCALGTLHPLLAVVEPARSLAALRAGAFIGVEGEPEGRAAAHAVARALGARPSELPAEAMALYHLAATVASNHLVALHAVACDLLGEAGLAEAQARPALLALCRSVLENLEAVEPAGALTGPVRRGDAATVARHLELLAARAPGRETLYRAASLELVRMVHGEGSAERAALERVLCTPRRLPE